LEETAYVGIYFGSQATKNFTAALEEVYQEAQCNDHHRLQIFYVGNDPDVKSFRSHAILMSWLIFPYGSSQGKRLQRFFNATQVPSFTILDAKNGQIISDRGVELVQRHGGQLFSMLGKLVYDGKSTPINKPQPLLSN